jgi:hypothetical protein
MNGGLIMGRQSKLRQLRRLQKNDNVLELNYSTCSSEVEAYRLLFQGSMPFAIEIWAYWRKFYAPHHPGFIIVESNCPTPPKVRVTIYPGGELKKWGQRLNITPGDLDLQGCIVAPSELERFKIPPPTIMVWYDGLPNGECVSQFLRCQYQ